jgi:N-acetylglucosamine-6-phosphate deacetylase
VCLVTLAPELPGAHEIITILRSQGVVVSAGHSMASYGQALAAFEAGICAGTHLFNAMPPLGHRTPGLVGALLDQPDIAVGLIVDGIHIHPAVVNLVWRVKGPDGLILVTDAMAAMGMSPGCYRLGGFDVIVADGSVRLPDGTLAGSVCSMDACLRNLIAYTGCKLQQAVNCCTLNPAQLLGLRDKGRLAPGMDADLVVLTSEYRIAATLAGGQVLYSQVPQLEETS